MHVYVFAGSSEVLGVDDGKWKVFSVQFTSGTIATVEMTVPGSDGLAIQKSGGYFQVAGLGGSGASFANGRAATITFEPGDDISAIMVDYTSMNTYVVQYQERDCVPVAMSPCNIVTTRFSQGSRPSAVIAFSGEPNTTEFDIYVYAQADGVRQVSIGFSSDMSSWSLNNVLSGLTSYGCDPGCLTADSFGLSPAAGASVPTGTKLMTLLTTDGACVTGCIDLENLNTNLETVPQTTDDKAVRQ